LLPAREAKLIGAAGLKLPFEAVPVAFCVAPGKSDTAGVEPAIELVA
jgi:hypothetical protein